jgi:hypothetical protein
MTFFSGVGEVLLFFRYHQEMASQGRSRRKKFSPEKKFFFVIPIFRDLCICTSRPSQKDTKKKDAAPAVPA